MEQRDYLVTQIEQLGKVLGKILADFLGLKTQGKASQAIEISIEQFRTELDMDIEKLVLLDKDALREYLQGMKFKAEHLEDLSRYFEEIGVYNINNDASSANAYLLKSIELLDLTDEFSNTHSFDRISKKARIREMIQQ